MKLAYRACDKSGKEFTDTIDAMDPVAAGEELSRRGLFVIEIDETHTPQTSVPPRPRPWFGRGRRVKSLAVFTKQLSVLVHSGTPLVEAIGALERQLPEGAWLDTVESVRASVEQGESLAVAMQAYPDYFDSAYCSLVAAGESRGNLSEMLGRLAMLKQTQLRVRNSIIGAMVYPALLTVIAVAVLALLLAFVVPRFVNLFETLDVPLPASTKVMLTISEVVRSYWPVILAGSFGLTIALVAWVRTPSGKRWLDDVVLRTPQIGKIVKSFSMARITRLLGVLLEGHVPVLEALSLTRSGLRNVIYHDLVGRAEELVSGGEPICAAFADINLVSPAVYEAVRNGERTGQLAPLLLNVADFLDDENDVVLRSLTSIIEPVILILMGLLVGTVAISLFMPLFDLTAMVQGA